LSRVIKKFDDSVHADASRAFEVTEVGDDAREIVASAKERAETIVAEARSDAEQIRREAHEKGLEEGKAAVAETLEAQIAEEIRKSRSREIEHLVKSLTTMIREVNDYRGRLMLDSKEQLISLAVSIARSVIKREVKQSEDVAKLNLEEAIRLSAKRSRLLIRVSEMDMKTLEDVLERQRLVRDEQSAVEFIPSPEIMPGGCLIESASGAVDARIETQLGEIEKVLIGEDADV